MIKTELTEKIGKRFFLEDDFTLAAILNYDSGISAFDEYLNGKTLKQINAVIHLTKYPKGLLIKIKKNFSSSAIGISYPEIKRTLLAEKNHISQLVFETVNGNIIFSLKTSRIYEVEEFLKDIHLKYDFEISTSGKREVAETKTIYNTKHRKK